MAGLKIVEIPMSKDGEVPKEAFKQKVSLNGREVVEDNNTNYLWPNFLKNFISFPLLPSPPSPPSPPPSRPPLPPDRRSW